MRKTVPDIFLQKSAHADSPPLVCLTAYTAPMAEILDPHCDILLVGDSVAMVLHGEKTTLQATMDMMILHGRSVVRASENALVVVDMPFGSYQGSKEEAFGNAARILSETGAQAVKLEGGQEMAETVAFLSQRGVPVMGHIGLVPQSVNMLGGYKAQGKESRVANKILADAKAIAQAGAFAIVVEAVAEPLARGITKQIAIPTIGIGASVVCDGQILVTEDMLGISPRKKPKFVKTYADMHEMISQAVQTYASEVRARRFPDETHVYLPAPDVVKNKS